MMHIEIFAFICLCKDMVVDVFGTNLCCSFSLINLMCNNKKRNPFIVSRLNYIPFYNFCVVFSCRLQTRIIFWGRRSTWPLFALFKVNQRNFKSLICHDTFSFGRSIREAFICLFIFILFPWCYSLMFSQTLAEFEIL